MKRSLLLIAAGLVAGIANGQEASKSMLFNQASLHNEQAAQAATGIDASNGAYGAKHAAAKTTATLSRWYDYVNDILGPASSPQFVNFTELPIWQDTSAIVGYGGTTPGYYSNSFTSVGLAFNGRSSAWNDDVAFPGVMAINTPNAYTIDSVAIGAVYGRPNSYSRIDTLILTFTQGAGSSVATDNMEGAGFSTSGLIPSYYGLTTTLRFFQMHHDSVNNRAGNNPLITLGSGQTATPITSATAVYKFLLYPTDTMNGTFVSQLLGQYPRVPSSTHPRTVADPVINYAVTASNYMGMSVSFKSGDHVAQGGTWPAFPGRDTIQYSGTAGAFKHSGFYPLLAFKADAASGGNALFPAYRADDMTSGYYKREANDAGWGGTYVPNWAWLPNGTTPSSLQFPWISYHVTCTTCALTGSTSLGVNNVIDESTINMFPNPANNELTVTFKSKDNVTVSLVNMVGQTVATQQVANGNAVFNTASLPAGIYICNLQANGGPRSAGRVVIAH